MSAYTVSITARIGAPAAAAYALIADYREGHPRILPPRYFRNLRVEQGGRGAGTRIRFQMGAMGQWRDALANVTEPEPGRVLHEHYPDTGVLTTFRVEPVGRDACEVTIATTMPGRAGLAGAVERWMITGFLRRVFRDELALLARVAGEARG